MKATLHRSDRLTYNDYLAVDDNSNIRHEFVDGVIIAMSGGTTAHALIVSRFAHAIMSRLADDDPCQYYGEGKAYWIEAMGNLRYADGSVICGEPQSPPHEKRAATNPAILIEVLSPTTAADDLGAKRLEYQSLPTLRAYVLAAQDEPLIQIYRRGTNVPWRDDPEVYRRGQRFELPCVPGAIDVAAIYRRIPGVSL